MLLKKSQKGKVGIVCKANIWRICKARNVVTNISLGFFSAPIQ